MNELGNAARINLKKAKQSETISVAAHPPSCAYIDHPSMVRGDLYMRFKICRVLLRMMSFLNEEVCSIHCHCQSIYVCFSCIGMYLMVKTEKREMISLLLRSESLSVLTQQQQSTIVSIRCPHCTAPSEENINTPP